MRMHTPFVWLVLMFAQRTAAWLQSSETVVLHQERVRLSNADNLLQQPVMSPAADGIIIPTKRNRSCRRCLQIIDDESSIVPVADPPAEDVDADVPRQPTDPPDEATSTSTTLVPPPLPPPVVITNPSSQLLEPPGDLNVDGKAAGGLAASGKVGVTAGVGAAAGAAVLVAGVLYYLKPDIFLCCKTCIRVQIFQHTNHASKP